MIYYYFGSKEGLYLAVLEGAYRRMRLTESELQLADLPPEERRQELMLRLEHIWAAAQGHTYKNKHGKEISMPDGTLQLKVVQAVAVLQGLTGQSAEEDAGKLEQMTDAQLVREATKRLPAHEVAQLADALIELREQQRSKDAIVTTGENSNGGKEEHGNASRNPRRAANSRSQGKPRVSRDDAQDPTNRPKWV